MKNQCINYEILPSESQEFLKSIDIDILEVNKLTEDGKLLFLIKSKTRQYVLKVNLPSNRLVAKIRAKLIGSIGFQQECLFYKTIKKNDFWRNYPEYFYHNKYNLLIGFLPKNNVECIKYEIENWQLVIKTLSIFHWNTTLPNKGLKSFLHRVIFSPQGVAFRKGIPTVKKVLGLNASIRFGWEIILCIRQQPKTSRRFLSHNDFLCNNLMFSTDFSKVFMIDFQDITSESRWPLYDLIRLIWHGKSDFKIEIKKEIIKCYIENLPSDIVKSLNIEAQVRFCVLVCVIQSLQWSLNNGHNYSKQVTFLRSILRNNEINEYNNEIVDIIKEHIYER